MISLGLRNPIFAEYNTGTENQFSISFISNNWHHKNNEGVQATYKQIIEKLREIRKGDTYFRKYMLSIVVRPVRNGRILQYLAPYATVANSDSQKTYKITHYTKSLKQVKLDELSQFRQGLLTYIDPSSICM